MKLFITGILFIFFQANAAFSQIGNFAPAAKYKGKYLITAGNSNREVPNTFSLLTVPSPVSNRCIFYSTIRMVNSISPYQKTKTPLWHNLLNLAGQLSLSVFAQTKRLEFNSRIQPYRYEGMYNQY